MIQNDSGGKSKTNKYAGGGTGGRFGGGAPAAVAAVQPIAQTPAPVSPPQYSQEPISYGGGGGGGGGGAMAAVAPVAPPSEEDYLAGDSGYQTQLAALKRALGDYTADDTAQRTKYNTDYSTGLKDLGWMNDDPTTAGVDESGWDWNDQNTASGRANQNQLNDFAGRGLLQSSLYATAKDNLGRSFNDQKTGLDKSKVDYLADRDRQLGAFKNDNTSSSQQARAEAIARRAASYAL